MEMQRDWERIIAETSAVAIPITAQPGEKEDWIRYSDSNEGEPGYYRDYLDPKTGAILYSFGETCCVHPWLCDPAGVLPSECHGLVLLSNENCDAPCFTVPLAQFKADFGPISDAVMLMLAQKPENCTLRLFLETDDPEDSYLDALDVKADTEDGSVILDNAFIHDYLDSSPAWQFCESAGMEIEVQDCYMTGYSSFVASTTADGLRKFLLEHKVIPVLIKKVKEK